MIGAIREQQKTQEHPNQIIPPASRVKPKPTREPVATELLELPKIPRYLEFTPKVVRMTQRQRQGLTQIARRLSHAKMGGERITDDTLIRVAISVFLEFDSQIIGKTEKEIYAVYRSLLNLKPRKFKT
jgi:hypothetical protein